MERIRRLASLAGGSKLLCDVGCDHGLTAITAVLDYGVEKAIASDINYLPLQAALKNIEKFGLTKQIKTVLSDGLKEIEEDFDTLIIAGMGGHLIVDILKASLAKVHGKKLILAPNRDFDVLRKFMWQNNFKTIHEEALIEKGKYYEILVFETGLMTYEDYDIEYGAFLRKNLAAAYVSNLNVKLKVAKQAFNACNDEVKRLELKRRISEIETILGGKNLTKHYLRDNKNYYQTYFVDDLRRPTVIIAPGGGYKYTSKRESEPVAKAFNAKGYHALVVNYRETMDPYPVPQSRLAEAIALIKEDRRVKELIGLGFSAGGHCLLEVVLHHKDYNLKSSVDLLMLGYPVITAKGERHTGSFENLLQNKIADQGLLDYLSLETQVDSTAPDLFLWGTYTDESVFVTNSLLLLKAYKKAGCNAEYHCFYCGGHGLSLADSTTSDGDPAKENSYVSRWFEMACQWLSQKLNK